MKLLQTQSIVGKSVKINSKGHTDNGSWGVVKAFDGEHYHVAITDDSSALLLFERGELRVDRVLNANNVKTK